MASRPTDAERKARADRYAEKFPSRAAPKQTEPKDPKKGQTYESPGGLSFTIVEMDKKSITVKVDRVVHKNDKQVIDVRTRTVLRTDFESFARPYTLEG